jgi:hypothetical protein
MSNIKKRKPLRIGNCIFCNNEFKTRYNRKIFCNSICKARWHNAKIKGENNANRNGNETNEISA